MVITIKHVVSLDPEAASILNRIADALEGKPQAEIDAAATTIGEVTEALKKSNQNLAAALSK